MLKDYYYSSIKPSTTKAIEDILSSQARFPTYGRFRGYMKRVQSCGKVFLWKGLYYEVSEECKNNLLCFLKADFKACMDDLHFKAFIDRTANELSRDGVNVPLDYGFCLNFKNEVKK